MRKTLKILGYLIFLFLVQEIVLRIVYPLPDLRNFDRMAFIKLGEEGFQYSRNQPRTWQSEPDTSAVFRHEMNLYGFRDAEWPIEKPASKKRYFFIGDSFIEGIMASQQETVPVGFELAGGAEVEVMNGGMVGKGLEAYLQLASDAIPVFKPDVAFLCIYANDPGKSPPRIPEFYLEPEYFNPWKPRFLEILSESKLRGAVHPVWGTEPSSYLPAIPNEANPWSQKEADLAPHVTPALAAQMKSGTFNPFRVNALEKEAWYLARPPQLGEAIPYFQYICKENDVRPVVAYFPSRNQVSRHYLPFEHELCLQNCPDSLDLTGPEYQIHQHEIARQCRQLKITFLDLTETVRKQEAAGNHLYWNYDEHMKGKGYLLLGREMWRMLQGS